MRKKIVDLSRVDIRKSMRSEPDWSLHRTFLAVVEEGSLSGAARRLGLTQPTIARHIDLLEAAIGAELFLRSQRGMIPTDMAQSLRPYAETLASTAAALMREASGTEGAVRGAVRVSASEIIGVEHLPPILTRLRRRYPELVVELVVSNAVDDLLQQEADVAVRNIEPTQDALVARRLPAVDLGLHARVDYLEQRGTPQTKRSAIWPITTSSASIVKRRPSEPSYSATRPSAATPTRCAPTTTWRNSPRFAPDSASDFARPGSGAAIPTWSGSSPTP
jgi:DNA-binding transcriptional LysR family regulator